jgi:hypothetical protein
LKKQLATWAGLFLLGLGAAGTARAQTIYVGPGLPDPALPPYEIMSIVRSTGLTPLTRPVRRGAYYVLVAVDRVGREMRVVVDAQLGDIVNLRPALAAGSYDPALGRPNGPPGFSAAAPDTGYSARPGGDLYGARPSAENALPPTPPRPIPGARAANAPPPGVASPPPTRLAVAEPALPPPPPLPRPRPKLALNEAPAAAPTDATAGPPAPKPAAPVAPPSAAPNAADEAAKSIE